MIDLMIKNIFESTNNRIDNITKYVNSINNKHGIYAFLLTASMYTIVKVIQNQDERIKYLEIQLEEMKSKGE